MEGYVPISRINGLLLTMLLKVSAYSGLVLVFCCLIYYIYGGILAIIMIFFAMAGVLYHVQDSLLFSPELPSHSRVYIPIPSMFGLPYESINTRGVDGTLIHMYLITQPKDRQRLAPTIIFFHGNAGNMGHRLQNCVGLYQNLHCNILLVEYRGYGLSEGSASEEGLYIDARASLDYLYTRSDINHSEIIVFGRSLGGAVAIDLTTREEYSNKIWCLVVENTFTSIPDMAKCLLRWRVLKYIPLFFYKNKFLSYKKINQQRIPSLFISGMADSLVPPSMMADLFNRCGSIRKQLLKVPAGTHNETWQLQGYYHALAVFLQNCRIKNLEIGEINNFNNETKIEHNENCIWNHVQNI